MSQTCFDSNLVFMMLHTETMWLETVCNSSDHAICHGNLIKSNLGISQKWTYAITTWYAVYKIIYKENNSKLYWLLKFQMDLSLGFELSIPKHKPSSPWSWIWFAPNIYRVFASRAILWAILCRFMIETHFGAFYFRL